MDKIRALSRTAGLGAGVLLALAVSACASGGGSQLAAQTYRLLEAAAPELDEAKPAFAQLAASMCKRKLDGGSQSAPSPVSVSIYEVSSEAHVEIQSYAACVKSAETRCNGGLFLVDTGSAWAWTMSRINYVAYHRQLAKQAGFPDDVIGSELKAIEALTLENIKRRQRYIVAQSAGGGFTTDDNQFASARLASLERAVALKWAAHLTKLPPNQQAALPVLDYYPNRCAASGEGSFRVRTDPPGARVWLISDFDWRLCRGLNQDPWDRERCDGWRLLVNEFNLLVGSYRYEARWSDGRLSRDSIRVEGANLTNVNGLALVLLR